MTGDFRGPNGLYSPAANDRPSQSDIDNDTWPVGYVACEWCAGPMDYRDGRDNACMIPHCLDCIGRCRACQDDMAQEGNR